MRYRQLLLTALLLSTGLVSSPAQAQSDQRCFAETQQCIAGPIRAYWEQNGGLPIFGYPISPQREELVEGTVFPVQWFERDRLEDHGAEGVMAGRLGARALELTFVPWEQFTKTDAAAVPAGCRFFEQTGHTLCEPYRSYWEQNGGLARFGYPITHPFIEPTQEGTYEVQYFERRRMEIHPELPGSPILLGLLGNVVSRWPADDPASFPSCLQSAPASLVAQYDALQAQLGTPLGCPAGASWEALPAAIQQFEQGMMLWLSERKGYPPIGGYSPTIFALSADRSFVYSETDSWVAGQDPDTPSATPPRAGLYAPWRGFGKVWINQPSVQQKLGWAIEAQSQAYTVDTQLFQSALLIRINETGTIYALGNRMGNPPITVVP